jgi:hypothetical protein
VGTMLFFASSSAFFAVDHAGIAAAILVLALIGAWYVTWRVPTRERVATTTPAPPVT